MDSPDIFGLPVFYKPLVGRRSFAIIHPDDRVEIVKWFEEMNAPKELSLNEYQRQSERTLSEPADVGPGSLSCLGLGIAGEAGEVADLIKKGLHHGHGLDRERIKKELGDNLWYIQGIASRLGFTLEEIAQSNIDKLTARYPEGFSTERSMNRAQEDE